MMTCELWRFITGVWKADKQDVRGVLKIAFAVFVFWPIGAVLIALLGHEIAFALIPYWGFLLVGPVVVFAYYYPFISMFAVGIGYTRNILRDISLVIGLELIIGIYCAWVPIANNRVLALELILISFALLFIIMGTQVRWGGKTKSVLVLFIIGITGAFFYDWTGKAQAWLMQPATTNLGNNQVYQAQPVMEDGRIVPEPQSYYIPPASLKKETSMEHRGPEFLFTTNCTEEVNLDQMGPIPPGKKVVIRHVTLLKAEDNRCSFVDWEKNGMYWHGPEGSGVNARFRKQFKNDAPLPHEDIPPLAVAFLMVEKSTGREINYGYAKHKGDEFVLTNTSNEDAIIIGGIFNYPQILKKGHEDDIGYDGSTLTYNIRME